MSGHSKSIVDKYQHGSEEESIYHNNTLVAIERGQGNPKIETLLSVADTLGLQIDIRLKE